MNRFVFLRILGEGTVFGLWSWLDRTSGLSDPVGREWAGLQLTRSKQCLACFEHHAIVYFKELIDKEPRAVGGAFQAVTILQNPIPVDILNGALKTRKLVVFKLDIAGGHTPDLNLFTTLEGENLVKLGAIDEFQLDAIIGIVSALSLVVCFKIPASTPSARFGLEEVDSQVWSAKRDDEAIFEG